MEILESKIEITDAFSKGIECTEVAPEILYKLTI